MATQQQPTNTSSCLLHLQQQEMQPIILKPCNNICHHTLDNANLDVAKSQVSLSLQFHVF